MPDSLESSRCPYAQPVFSPETTADVCTSFTVTVDSRRITQLAALYPHTTLPKLPDAHLQETLSVQQNNQTCRLSPIRVWAISAANFRATGHFTCPVKINVTTPASIGAFAKISAEHIHIVRTGEGDATREHVLTRKQHSFALVGADQPQSLLNFLRLGFEHVLSGLDHLAFLLTLSLLAGRMKPEIYCITGFTLGHSATLALATLGLIAPNERLIKALIGFTIAITA